MSMEEFISNLNNAEIKHGASSLINLKNSSELVRVSGDKFSTYDSMVSSATDNNMEGKIRIFVDEHGVVAVALFNTDSIDLKAIDEFSENQLEELFLARELMVQAVNPELSANLLRQIVLDSHENGITIHENHIYITVLNNESDTSFFLITGW